jgi:hypothetical protein
MFVIFNNILISSPAELVLIVDGICLPPHTQRSTLTELRTWFLIVVYYFACPLTYRKAPYRTKSVVFNSDVFCLSSDAWEILCRTKNMVSNSGVFFLSPDTWTIS